MKLRRLRLEQLRQFRQPIEINDFGAGINVFSGPNESGKSTVVRAIRAAFFERYKSSSLDDLQPWGDTSASPSIELEFDWQGERWKLRKSFLKSRRCDLEIAGRQISGEQAEARLAQLLGFEFSAKGASKAQHWGIPGLLWIDQGRGQDIQTPVLHAGNYLKSALGESLGEIASGMGDELTASVERERKALLTATGRPTGDYAQAQRQQAGIQEKLAELDDTIAAYRRQVDRLGELRSQQREDAAKPWEAYRSQARLAEARLAEVQDWVQARQREENQLRDCQGNQQICRDQLAAYGRQQADLAQRDQQRKAAEESLSQLEARRPRIDEQLGLARSAYEQADDILRQARRRQQCSALARETDQADQELAALDGKLAQARGLQAQQLARRGRLQANRVDADAAGRLRKLSRTLAELDIAKQHAATRLHFDLQPERRLELGGDTLEGQGQRLLLEPAELNIPGVGRLRIHPGGDDTAELARRQQTARNSFSALLDELRVDSLEQAETLAEQRRTLQDEIERGDFQLNSLAPKGVDELASQRDLCQQRREGLRSELAALPQPSDASADISVGAAEDRLEAAGRQLREAERARSQFEMEAGLARQAATSAAAEWQRLRDALQAPDRREREKALNDRLADLRADETRLRQSLEKRRRQIDEANPDILRQDIERYIRSAESMEGAAQKRQLELAGLQSRLDALGADGLEERRAALARELAFTSRRCDEFDRRAAALDLLLTLLRDKRQALTRRIQAPLQRHLNRYLQLLFPHASLSIDEDLMPQQLMRIGRGERDSGGGGGAGAGAGAGAGQEVYEDFAALSFGAREQMGLVSRLAYADLLKEAGHPTLIILDDALVHSDPGRLAQMKRILFDAGQRHQVLLFTCHPDNWRDLGATPIEMAALGKRPPASDGAD